MKRGLLGRRGGKDRCASVLAAYFAGLCDHSSVLAPGEKAVLTVLAPDTRQAQVQLDYIEGCFKESKLLNETVVNRTADTLELDNNVLIEVRSASFRRIRGITSIAVIASEASFWLSEDSSNPDTEILNAVRPSLITTQGPLIIISSPYARRGEVWNLYDQHFGDKGDPRILVIQGSSRDFNPTLPEEVIARAYQANPASASAEYGGLFRTDVERFISIEALRECTENGVRERAPDITKSYIAFTDPSGGSGDSFTLAVAHVEGESVVLDCVRERESPFDPADVCSEFADTLKSYRVSRVVGDRYGGVWPAEQFKKCGITYEATDRPKSQLYVDLLPLINSSQIRLLDHARLEHQLINLERSTSRGGRDSVDHPPAGRDDVANSVAGVASLANRSTGLMSKLIANAFTDGIKPLW